MDLDATSTSGSMTFSTLSTASEGLLRPILRPPASFITLRPLLTLLLQYYIYSIISTHHLISIIYNAIHLNFLPILPLPTHLSNSTPHKPNLPSVNPLPNPRNYPPQLHPPPPQPRNHPHSPSHHHLP